MTSDPFVPAKDSPYLGRFGKCGKNVRIAPGAFIQHPEVFEIGDDVTIYGGVQILGKPVRALIGSHVIFHTRFFHIGSPNRLEIGDKVEFFPGVFLASGERKESFIEIGHHSHFAPGAVLYGWGGLKIGPYCNVAAHVVLATTGHHDEILDRPMALTGGKYGPITIEEDIWIGANATVTANTTLARGSIIGANAVVTKDTEPFGVYGGVPARLLRSRKTCKGEIIPADSSLLPIR